MNITYNITNIKFGSVNKRSVLTLEDHNSLTKKKDHLP